MKRVNTVACDFSILRAGDSYVALRIISILPKGRYCR